uniref:VRK serine/threonine kinase 3 n=1 Tax=Sander lucioperca TaxID=283035 RepID=A0A8D0AJU8_SANLU
MPFRFCPQCGTKLQPDFRFCPSCGEKLPCPVYESEPVSTTPSLSLFPAKRDEALTSVVKSSLATSSSCERRFACQKPCPVHCPVTPQDSVSESQDRKGKAKKAKHAPTVEPLRENEEVTDTTGKKWKLEKLLSQSTTELIYEVLQTVSRSNSKESNHILKLGAKDGRIFNEQNFLQRAAKPASVDKWIKQNKMDFLGIPSCVGFGLHAESYRFLIFPNMGQSLQSVMEEEDELLSEKAVLQLACRILDVLQYIHSNEYVHADINAENIYIKPGQKSQVYLVGYCHAFRYCPGGQHVEYREASRTPHEGTMEFISLDAHKGAAPSRRSDLQSLGYCMLRWHAGTLPWALLAQPDQVATQKQRYMEDVPALLSHCFGKKRVSSAFQTYLTEVMTMQYSEQPDYSLLKAGLSAALLQLGGNTLRESLFLTLTQG